MQIQWYPGHMAKARRMIEDNLKLVSVVVEVVDARAPASTRNPDFDDLFRTKPCVTILNKADLADPATTKRWAEWHQQHGRKTLALNSTRQSDLKPVIAFVQAATQERVDALLARGMKMTVRAMVVGIPNVGKSTFINLLKGKASAKASDRPGVTRGKQWVPVTPYLEFLDTPGLLWPKLDDQEAARRLAYLGSVRDDIIDIETLAARFLADMALVTPSAIAERYKLTDLSAPGHELLDQACIGRGWLLSGGRMDTARGAAVILDEFRQGRLGRITLETPESGGAGEG